MNTELRTVAALFVRGDSVYKMMPGVDAWDASRDAMSYDGSCPVVCHPPCRLFGRLAHFSRAVQDEKQLAYQSVRWARLCGGVVEHPAHSRLWSDMGMVGPGQGTDNFGGFTIAVNQFAFGHKARKPTWFYVVRSELPTLPVEYGEPRYCVARRTGQTKKHVTKAEREHTPPRFGGLAGRSGSSITPSNGSNLTLIV